jgi:hypothetical protein
MRQKAQLNSNGLQLFSGLNHERSSGCQDFMSQRWDSIDSKQRK